MTIYILWTILSFNFIQYLVHTESAHHENYDFQSTCNKTVNISRDSTGIISATRHGFYEGGKDCFFVIFPPPGYGLIINVNKVRLRRLHLIQHQRKCLDWLIISDEDEIIYGPSCKSKFSAAHYFRGTGDWKFHFLAGGSPHDVVHQRNFEVIYTTYHEGPCSSEEFQCLNKVCIHKDLKCNGYNNCGDNSDENRYSGPHCSRKSFGSFIGIGVGLLTILLVTVGLLYLRKRRRRAETYVSTNISSAPAQVYSQPYPPQQYPQSYPLQTYPTQPYFPQQFPEQQYPAQSNTSQQYPAHPYPPQQYPVQSGTSQQYPTEASILQQYPSKPDPMQSYFPQHSANLDPQQPYQQHLAQSDPPQQYPAKSDFPQPHP